MKITEAQYKLISTCFPRHRKPAVLSNLDVLNAILFVLENGCKWRALPKEYGNWHTLYVRMNRWAKNGLLQKVFLHLQQVGIIRVNVTLLSLDSTSVKVHPDGMGVLKKLDASQSVDRVEAGIPKYIWCPHLIGMQ
jgi:transposase